MNAKLVWGGGLIVFLGLGIGLFLLPKDDPEKIKVAKSGHSHKTETKSPRSVSLSKTSQVGEKKPNLEKPQAVVVPNTNPQKRSSDRHARQFAQKLQARRQTADQIIDSFIRLKGAERKNHPAYKAFIAEGGTDEDLEKYKLQPRSRGRSRNGDLRLSPELRKKEFVVVVHKGSGKALHRASVDIELRANIFPGPKDMILILKHSETLKAESFFAHALLQATRKKVTFQDTGKPGESLIHIRGSSDPLMSGTMLTLKFIVEGRDPSVTPIYIREISQLGVRSPNAGTVGNVMQIR